MLPLPRVSLTKACNQCIKSKRKCDRRLPKCRRCSKMHLTCGYMNIPLGTAIGKSLLDDDHALSPARGDLHLHREFSGPMPRHLIAVNTDEQPSPSSLELVLATVPRGRLRVTLGGVRLGPPDVVLTLDASTMTYMTEHLRSFPEMFYCTGGTPFIHPQLYSDSLPPLLKEIHALCALHSNLNQANQHLLHQRISTTTHKLLNFMPSAHTFPTILEFLQSLILLQTITVFFPTTENLRYQAEHRMSLLQSWTVKLYNSIPAYLPPSLTRYEAWLLAESVRRTIHIAHIIQGTYSVMTRGHFVHTAFVETLPLNKRSLLWEYDSLDVVKLGEIEIGGLLETDLISYRELVDRWDSGEVRPGDLRIFEEMLVVACKGAGRVGRGGIFVAGG